MCTNNLYRFIPNKQNQLIRVPCKYFCMECRNMRREEYTQRLLHEWKTSGYIGSFITLTYRDTELLTLLPPGSAKLGIWFKLVRPFNDSTLSRREASNITDKISKRVKRKYGHGIKYVLVGEYGDDNHRPIIMV